MLGFDVINLLSVLDPVTAVREQEATERAAAYPQLAGAGPARFGIAEQNGRRWRLLSLGSYEPAGARRELAAQLRLGHEKAGDRALRARMLALAGRLDPEEGEAEGGTEWIVGTSRYRIVRSQGFVRVGPDGPEPARFTDTEPAEQDPFQDFALEPAAPSAPSEALLRLELAGLGPAPGTVPPQQVAESRAALAAHPGVVLLPVHYTVMQRLDGQWLPVGQGEGPAQARASLRFYLRMILPRFAPPGSPPATAREIAQASDAADALEHETRNEFEACGRLFRIVRAVRTMRVGPDGPEPARPSDEQDG